MTYHNINSIVAVSRNGWITLGIIESRTEIQSRVGTSVAYEVWLLDGSVVTFPEELVTEFYVMTYASQYTLIQPIYEELLKESKKRENQKDASETENS